MSERASSTALPRAPALARHRVGQLLDQTWMYRLVVVALAVVLACGAALGAAGLLPVAPLDVAGSTALLVAVSLVANALLARAFSAPTSVESPLATALILALIAGPVSIQDPAAALKLALAGLLAVASKFLIAPRRQHVFNPAAFGVFVAGALFHSYSTWWVGNLALLPVVAVAGLLIVRKVGRLRVVAFFLAAFAAFLTGFSLLQGVSLVDALSGVVGVVLHTEVVFLAAVMLTEPITSPKTLGRQMAYAAIVAFLLLPQLSIAGMSLAPEAALLAGNLFSFLVSPHGRLELPLRRKSEIGPGIWSFAFDAPAGFAHRVGQYMEWVLPLRSGDSRGNRRYLTIASTPGERELMFAVRIPERPSAYKQALLGLQPGDRIVASELSGDFVLPSHSRGPVALIAGGIGVTPFRSMIKSLLERDERRPVTLLYSGAGADEILFRDVFDRAADSLGLHVVYTLTDASRIGPDWGGKVGPIDAAMIEAEVADLAHTVFYVSGPPSMVDGIKEALRSLGVGRMRIRTDYFPGYIM